MSAKTLLLVLLVVGGSYVNAQDLPILLESGSKIWFQGTAGPVGFSCSATKVDVSGSVHMARIAHDEVKLNVTIPVRLIDCGLEGINNDMRDALKHRLHPNVTYSLAGFNVVGQRGLGHWVDTRGKLTVAGATRDVTIRILGHPDSRSGMRITGQYEFDMTDYGIVPPSPMMGMIKVNKKMDIYFDVTFRADRNQLSSN